MNKKLAIMIISSILFTIPILAEEELPTGGVTIDNQFVTNFVFRGDDVLKNYYAQRGQKYGGFNRAGAYQPSITFTTPIDGLTFNIWGNFSLSHRKDTDADDTLQMGAGQPSILAGNCDILGRTCAQDIVGSNISPAVNSVATSGLASNMNPATGGLNAPGFYKEQNGLRRTDEMDLTLDYTRLTTAGKFSFGMIHYSLLNSVAKGNPFTNGGSTYYTTEMYAGYALAKLPDLMLKVNSDIITSNQYFSLAYSHTTAITPTLGFLYGLSSGYSVKQYIQGWQDVTGKLGMAIGGFTAGVNFAYRPQLKMMEAIMNEDPNTRLPMWLEGASSVYDGQVKDPSRNTIVDRLINRGITQYMSGNGLSSYVYQPRQKLPRTLTWINVGYSVSF